MKYYTDNARIMKGIWMLVALVFFLIALGVYFLKTSPGEPASVVIPFVGAAAVFGLMLWVLSGVKKGTAFEVTDHSIRVGKDEILAQDIMKIRFYATLNATMGQDPRHGNLDGMVASPPAPGLLGGLKITTQDRKYTLSSIKDVMSAYKEIIAFTDRVEAVYRLGSEERPYYHHAAREKKEWAKGK